MQARVVRRAYFRHVTADAGDDRAAWEAALDLIALGMARTLSIGADPPSPRDSQQGGGGLPDGGGGGLPYGGDGR